MSMRKTSKTHELAARIKDKGSRLATDRAKSSDLEYFWAWAKLSFNLTESYPINWEIILNFVVTHLEGELPENIEKTLVANKIKQTFGRHKLKTVKRRISTLSWKHKELGFFGEENQARHHEITEVLKKAGNDISHKATASKAVVKDTLKQILSTIGDSNIDIRDKAIIALAWASGRRRSETNSLCIENIIERKAKFYIFELLKHKTSKSSEDSLKFKVSGSIKAYLDHWLKVSRIKKGRIFTHVNKNGVISNKPLSDTQIYRIIKKRFNEAAIDESDLMSPHSLRSGFVTELGKQGGNIGDGMALTGHKTLDVFMSYYQAGEAESNSAADLFDDE